MKKGNTIKGIAIVGLILLAIAIFNKFKGLQHVMASGGNVGLNMQSQDAGANYANYCAGCHGDNMEAFVDRKWVYGNSRPDVFKAIKFGYPNDGMSSYDTTFTDEEIYALTDYIMGGIENQDKYKFDNDIKTGETIKSEELDYKLEIVMDKLDSPWGMTVLPTGELLVSDRNGILYKKANGKEALEIKGVPEVLATGQGGLMDVELHPDFDKTSILYLSYSKPNDQGDRSLATTAIFKARLIGNELVDGKVIFEAKPYFPTRHHYGSRIVFDKAGYMFFSVGERGRREINPQNLDNHCGKIHRLNDDGSIPDDNPFYGQIGEFASIYSYGHRNPQGLAFNPETGALWEHEHGPRGGDEINIIKPGKNYGWPVVSYGINYNGTSFTEITEKEGMEQPIHYWVPSIAPCGMAFVTGDRYKAWKGDLLIGSLRFKYLNRCKIEDNKVVHEELLLKNIGRLRNVEMGSDGHIYVSTESPGVVYRIVPL